MSERVVWGPVEVVGDQFVGAFRVLALLRQVGCQGKADPKRIMPDSGVVVGPGEGLCGARVVPLTAREYGRYDPLGRSLLRQAIERRRQGVSALFAIRL